MKFRIAIIATMLIVACSDTTANLSTMSTMSTMSIESVEPADSSLEVTTTIAGGSTDDMTGDTAGVATTSTLPGAETTSSTSDAASTRVSATSTTAGKAVTTTVANLIRPKLSVSQTTNLNPNGTSVTVRGTGYDISKGVYVIVCTQAAPGPQATCVGGVNIDGSSSSSVWVSSNPPGYGVGLTTPFSPDGSFTVDLVVVAKSGALDCTVVKCGVVTRSDHLRYTDRSQDVFVPITFSN